MNASTPERCRMTAASPDFGLLTCCLEAGHEGKHRLPICGHPGECDEIGGVCSFEDCAFGGQRGAVVNAPTERYYCTGCETYSTEPGICHGLERRDLKPVRVEEPAGEHVGSCRIFYAEQVCTCGVAQSANADVREELAVGLNSIIDTPYGEFTKGDYAAFIRDIAHSLLACVAALPVPVGDETEALREHLLRADLRIDDAEAALGGIDYEEGSRVDRAFIAIEEAGAAVACAESALTEIVARVAGLEAREAALRDALRRIRADSPHFDNLPGVCPVCMAEAALQDDQV